MPSLGYGRSLAILIMLAPTSVPAGGDKATDQVISVSRTLSARANWENNDHPNYRYVMQRQCYCASPNDIEVVVAENRVIRVIDRTSGNPVPASMLGGYKTIRELFAEIDQAVERRPDSLHIEYDRHLGFPKTVRIDFSYQIGDDEIDYSLTTVTLP